MKKRTSRVSRRVVSLLMSLVLTLTLVTPAAFATEVAGGSGTTIVEGDTNPADANPSGDNEGKDDENKDTEHGGDEQPTNPGDEDKNPGEGEDDVNASSNEADTQEGEGTDTPVVAQRTVTLEKWNKNAAYDVKIVIPAATSEPGEGETTEAPGEGENAGSGNETLSTEYTGTDEKITLKLTTEDYTDNPIIYIKSSADEVVAETTPKLGDDGTLEYVFTGEETDITLYYGTKDDFVSAWYGDGSATKYTIRSAEELAHLATLVNGGNDFSGKTVTLARDIDLGGVQWISIGVEGHPFKGTFAGGDATTTEKLDCHKVSGLNGDLFGVVEGNRYKTTIQYVTISGGTGRLVNELKSGKVENCMSTAKVDSSDENAAVGGLVGMAETNATVSSSYYYNADSINVPAVGGSGTVTNCFYLAETSTFGSTADENGENGDTGARTAEEFAAGRVTWGLNGSEKTLKNSKNYWGQKDDLPYLVLNKPVYELTLTAKSVVLEGMSVTLSKDGQPALKNGNTQYLYYPSGDNTGIKVAEAGIAEDYTVTYSPKNPEDANLSFVTNISALTFYYSIVKTIEPDTSWYDNSGEYELYDAADLFGFAELVKGNILALGLITLGADIDLTGYDWTPVGMVEGNDKYGFYGMTFDGQGHKITGLSINATGDRYVGFFRYLEGGSTVKNLQVEGNITAEYNDDALTALGDVGGIAGYVENGSTIENCLSNVAVEATGNGWNGIGGVVGMAERNSVVNLCWNTGRVTARGDGIEYVYLGGIVGDSNTTITNCANFGTVTCDGNTDGSTGGIMGSSISGFGNVANSYNLGNVTGGGCGGIVGNDGSTVKNSYYADIAGETGTYVRNSAGTDADKSQSITITEVDGKKVYKVSDTELVEVLNENCKSISGALQWLNKFDEPFNPVHIYKWNGELEPGVPGTATLIYQPNGATSGTKQTEALRVGENESEATFTIKTDVALGFKHENGTFLGWSEDSKAATPTYKFDASKGTFTLAKISVDKDETVTLYAVWENIWTGSGTEAAPYEISSKDELTALATQVNDKGFSYAGKRFKLTADIALNGDEWTPIGKGPKNCFEGSLIGDGDKGTTISGLCIEGSRSRDAAGLFGYVKNSQSSSQFDKLTLKDVNITNRGNYTGGLIGSVQGLKSIPLSHITVSGTISGGKYTGGILGNGYAVATECTVSGSVTGENVVGGLAAGIEEGNSYGEFTNCYNEATVRATSDTKGMAAGIQAGSGSIQGRFEGCTNSGAIIANGEAAGIANSAQKIEGCQNSGAVSGTTAVGIGRYVDYVSKCSNSGRITGNTLAAGISASSYNVSFCSNIGMVTTTAGNNAYGIYAGGFPKDTNTIKNCFSYVTGKDIALAPNTLAEGKVTNSYYLASSATAVSSAGEYATLADFASGKVAWGVDGGTAAHANYWTQGANNYPVPIGEGTSTSYYRAQATCGTGGTVTIKRGDGRTGDADNAVYGPSGTKVTVTATPMDNTYALKSMTVQLPVGTAAKSISNPATFTMPNEGNVLVTATFGSATPSGGGGYYYGGSGDGTGTGDKDDEGLQDGLNMDVEYDIKGLVLDAYAEWGSNGGNKSFQKWLEENPNVVRALLTNSLDNMATAAVGKKTDEAKDLAALLLASLNEHTGVDGKNGDTIAKALQKYIDSGSEEVFSAWLTGGGGMASGTYESIYGQYASSLAALADRLYSKWEASGTSMTFPVWLDSQQVTMESLSENAEEPDAEPDDTQTTEAPEDVPDGQDTEGGASGNSVWEVIGTVVRENPILVWSIVAVIAALIIVGAVRRYHKVKRDEHDEK